MIIEPLTQSAMDETIRLSNSSFPLEAAKRWPEIAYKASLGYSAEWEMCEADGMDMCRYWVMGSPVVGTIGLYHAKSDGPSKGWLGWFCVAKGHRGKGHGERLLKFAIQEAKRIGFRQLWLYTSLDPDESAAQFLYEKFGFKIQSELEEDPYNILFRKKKLK